MVPENGQAGLLILTCHVLACFLTCVFTIEMGNIYRLFIEESKNLTPPVLIFGEHDTFQCYIFQHYVLFYTINIGFLLGSGKLRSYFISIKYVAFFT